MVEFLRNRMKTDYPAFILKVDRSDKEIEFEKMFKFSTYPTSSSQDNYHLDTQIGGKGLVYYMEQKCRNVSLIPFEVRCLTKGGAVGGNHPLLENAF